MKGKIVLKYRFKVYWDIIYKLKKLTKDYIITKHENMHFYRKGAKTKVQLYSSVAELFNIYPL